MAYVISNKSFTISLFPVKAHKVDFPEDKKPINFMEKGKVGR